ncbi:hypothetical protein JY89_11035 [Neisseria meningitidis]|nr:hypothetical protein JY54_09465 [Neisseria meningitidis]RPD26490.1 hypothetical protein JY89_11035 [Neisseria meningitidis]
MPVCAMICRQNTTNRVVNTICLVMLAAVLKSGFTPSRHLMQLRSVLYCLLHTNGQGLKVLSVMKPIFQGTDMKYTVRSIIMIQKALLISAAV